jgi:2-dehydro-3-deoxygalactonokinase
MKHFLSCDWGTSSLRLRLADTGDGKILAEARSAEGIARTFGQWQQSSLAEDKKAGFYLEVIDRLVRELESQTGQPLNGLTLILSGMASSSIGFIDLPYASMPFSVDGEGLVTAVISANQVFGHDVLVISGAKTDSDVMRGEETQLIGCIEPARPVKNELFIFPGTHSKHILIKDNGAVGLKTYMTGEVFSLMAQNSILKNSVEAGTFDADAFGHGLIDSGSGNLLHQVFKVRTNGLFGISDEHENYHYLSGLLIGSEIRDIGSTDPDAINLVCGDELRLPYQTALNELVPGKKLSVFSTDQADEATVRGQLIIAKRLKILT